MSNRLRIIIYLGTGLLVGASIDLTGLFTELLISRQSPLQAFIRQDKVELVSTLITSCMMALIALLLAMRENSRIALLDKVDRQNADLNMILENSPLAKLVVTPGLTVLYHNRPAAVFHHLGMAVGLPFPSLHDWRQHRAAEFSVTDHDRTSWYRLFETPVQWQGQDAVLVSLEDITADKEVERIRVDVERIIHHDIRSPLCGIIGITALMLEKPKGWEGTEECLKGIKEGAEQVCNLVDQMSLIYKLEGGQWQCPLQPVDLGEILAGMTRRLQLYANQHRVGLQVAAEMVTGQQDATCCGNQMLLAMLLENLLKNAIEASQTGDLVTVDLRTQQDRLRLTVTNPGSLPATIRDRFFEKYVTHGKENGTGLGTYLCKLVVTACNGTIVATENDFPPTVAITVQLPRWCSDGQNQSGPTPPTSPRPPAGRP